MRPSAFFMIFFLFVCFSSNILNAQPCHICDDDGEWAPYSFFERVDGKPDKAKAAGAAVELVRESFKLVGMECSIDMIPWKRCLAEVENYGVGKTYEAFINGSFNSERAEKYWVTTALYETHDAIFYSKKKFPNGIRLEKASDINNFLICGVNGYQYEYLYSTYGLAKDKKIDTGAKSLFMALEKISADRCDILSNSYEPVFGGVAIGQYELPPDIDFQIVPNGITYTYHMFISKSSPRAFELLTRINQAILILQHNGMAQSIFDKYIPKK